MKGQAPRVSENSRVSILARLRIRVNLSLAFLLEQLDSRAVSSRVSTANSLNLQVDEFLHQDNILEDEMTECSMLMTSLSDWLDQAQRDFVATASTSDKGPRGRAEPSASTRLCGHPIFPPRSSIRPPSYLLRRLITKVFPILWCLCGREICGVFTTLYPLPSGYFCSVGQPRWVRFLVAQ